MKDMSQSYYESPLKQSNSKNGAQTGGNLQNSFFEEIKQKLFPHEKALLLQKGTLNSLAAKTSSDGELIESSYFVSTPGKEIKDLLKRFSSLDCSAHKIRQYDHICSLVGCGQAKTLFCSQCLLENEDHTKAHKNDIIPMENYLSAKTDNLSGERQCKRVRLMMKDLVQMKENLDDQQDKLKSRIEQDLNEIESTVRSYCAVLKENLFSKVRKHVDQKSQELKQLLTQLQEQEQVLFQQQADILQDFKSTLTQNFDFSNTEQVNSFVKKIRSKTNIFSIDNVIQYCDDQIDALHEQESQDKISAYCQEQVEQTKRDLSKVFEMPLNNSSFVNFSVSNQTKTQLSTTEVSLDDKRLNVEKDKIFTGKEKKIKYSLQQEITSLTTHKSPINSIAVIDPFTFACVSNDSKLKIWGVTNANLVLHEKASLDLDDLCLNIKYSSKRKQLLCAFSKGTIELYEILPEIQAPRFIRKYEGHVRTARAVSIVESLNGFVSISYDETIKFWEWERSVAVASENYKMDMRVMDSNELYVLLGSCKDSVLLAYEIKRTSNNQFQGFMGMSNIKGIPITNKITCVSLFPKDSPLGLCGSNSGTQWLINVKTEQCLQKYEIHKDRVFSIIPISISQNSDPSKVQAFVSASWDGKICVCDSESGQIVSSCKYGLSNDSKKHWNTDGVKGIMSEFKEAQKDDGGYLSGGTYDFRLFSIGNDDRNIQVLKLTLSNY